VTAVVHERPRAVESANTLATPPPPANHPADRCHHDLSGLDTSALLRPSSNYFRSTSAGHLAWWDGA